MPDNAFDRTILNALERPLSPDHNQALSQMDRTIRELADRTHNFRAGYSSNANALSPAGTSAFGFIGDAFRAVPVTPEDSATATQIGISPGLGYLSAVLIDEFTADNPSNIPSLNQGVEGLNDLSPYKPVILTAQTVFSPPQNNGAGTRVDRIEVKYNRVTTNPTVENGWNPVTGEFDPRLVNQTLSFNVDGQTSMDGFGAINYALGRENGVTFLSPASPGYVVIAYVVVPVGKLNFNPASIIDRRPLIFPGGTIPVSFVATVPDSSNIPVISSVVAPPGIQVGAISHNLLHSAIQFFIFAGRMNGFDFTPSVSVMTQLGGDRGGGFVATTSQTGIGNSLNGALSASALSLTLHSSSLFPPSGAVTVDTEVIEYAANDIASNTLSSLSRGASLTFPAPHTDGTSVSLNGVPVVLAVTMDISLTSLTIILNDSLSLPGAGYVMIDDEIINYSANNTSTNTLSGLIRGALFTQFDAHSKGTPVLKASLDRNDTAQVHLTKFVGDGNLTFGQPVVRAITQDEANKLTNSSFSFGDLQVAPNNFVDNTDPKHPVSFSGGWSAGETRGQDCLTFSVVTVTTTADPSHVAFGLPVDSDSGLIGDYPITYYVMANLRAF